MGVAKTLFLEENIEKVLFKLQHEIACMIDFYKKKWWNDGEGMVSRLKTEEFSDLAVFCCGQVINLSSSAK